MVTSACHCPGRSRRSAFPEEQRPAPEEFERQVGEARREVRLRCEDFLKTYRFSKYPPGTDGFHLKNPEMLSCYTGGGGESRLHRFPEVLIS